MAPPRVGSGISQKPKASVEEACYLYDWERRCDDSPDGRAFCLNEKLAPTRKKTIVIWEAQTIKDSYHILSCSSCFPVLRTAYVEKGDMEGRGAHDSWSFRSPLTHQWAECRVLLAEHALAKKWNQSSWVIFVPRFHCSGEEVHMQTVKYKFHNCDTSGRGVKRSYVGTLNWHCTI